MHSTKINQKPDIRENDLLAICFLYPSEGVFSRLFVIPYPERKTNSATQILKKEAMVIVCDSVNGKKLSSYPAYLPALSKQWWKSIIRMATPLTSAVSFFVNSILITTFLLQTHFWIWIIIEYIIVVPYLQHRFKQLREVGENKERLLLLLKSKKTNQKFRKVMLKLTNTLEKSVWWGIIVLKADT